MPSAPVITVTIDGCYDHAFPPIETTAFVDLGADGNDGAMLPEDVLQRVHAKYTRSKRLIRFVMLDDTDDGGDDDHA